MKEVRRAFNYPQFKCQVLDYDSILNMADGLEIKSIEFDEILEIGGELVTYTDDNHPLVFSGAFRKSNTLIVNKEYYYEHKKEIDILIMMLCEKANTKEINVYQTSLISDELITGLGKNKNIKIINLGTKNDVYLLREKDYEVLNNGFINIVDTYGVSKDLENNYDSMIKFNQRKKLVAGFNYQYLTNEDLSFLINMELSEEDLNNLKYLNENASIEIFFDDCKQIVEVMNRFKELGQERKYTIYINEKKEFNEYLMQHIDDIDKNTKIDVGLLETVDLGLYLKYEERLIDMIMPAMDLSPFEKYLYAYNIVKKFKKYKENEDDKSSSRLLYNLLDSEYMVCVGYTALFCDLLERLGIPNVEYSVRLANGLENLKADTLVLPDYYDEEKKEEVLIEKSGHARCKVNLVDPKYGIDGYYIADPTWDNDMEDDFYNFCLMTNDEYLGINKNSFVDIKSHDELYFVHSLEEFYYKLNFLLDKNPDKKVNNFIKSFIEELKKLDPMFYMKLIEKYPILETRYIKNLEKEMIQDILLDVGEQIINKTNNFVSGAKIIECIKYLYNNVYGMSEVEASNKLMETLKRNRERQEEAFPIRYKIDSNGVSMVIQNAVNKFDLEDSFEYKI